MNKRVLNNIEKGRECIEFYFDEIESIRSKKFVSSAKIYDSFFKLSLKWLNDDKRCFLSATFDAYISEVLYNELEKYKPVPFKDKIRKLVKRIKIDNER